MRQYKIVLRGGATLESPEWFQASLRDAMPPLSNPWTEVHGYLQSVAPRHNMRKMFRFHKRSRLSY